MRLVFNKGKEKILVPVNEILFIMASDHCCKVVKASDVIEIDECLTQIEYKLREIGFIRVSRFCMVYKDHIMSYRKPIKKRNGGIICLSNGSTIEVARRFRKDLLLSLE